MRRIVTGLDENGRSAVLYDGPPQSIHHVTSTHVGALAMSHVPAFLENVPAGNVCVAEIWRTTGLPRPRDPDPYATAQPFLLEPDGRGLMVRYHVWGPHLDSSTMHATDTLDVNVVISGSVTLFLEEGRSVELHAGDSVVLPGNLHGWRAGPYGVTLVNIMQRLAAA